MPSIRLCDIQFRRLNLTTRFPFRYGIASMTEVPHLLTLASFEIDGRLVRGASADGLPPKWFTKNPETSFDEDDLPGMLQSIRQAADLAQEIGLHPSFFQWWQALYESQLSWANENVIPPLLAGFGVSLMERAGLDALLRAIRVPFFQAAKQNLFEIQCVCEGHRISPGQSLARIQAALPEQPRRQVHLRHTIGLGDPISEAADAARPDDGLPLTLAENIDFYGLRYFKIKLGGNPLDDAERLINIAEVVTEKVGTQARITLDGNESYSSLQDFRVAWENFQSHAPLNRFLKQTLLFVEQPVHRNHALDEGLAEEFRQWQDAPPIIIDESDAELTSLSRAFELGYAGTSHKNCKGVMKGILTALKIADLRDSQRNGPAIIHSAEDLGNMGPLALLQDLAVVASLGIAHVERNGHHYFAGLSAFPESLQRALLQDHADLFTSQHSSFARLSVIHGKLSLETVNAAPFGLQSVLDFDAFEHWDF